MHANIKIKEEYNYNVINFNNITEDKSRNKSNQNQVDSYPKKKRENNLKLIQNLNNLKTGEEDKTKEKSSSYFQLNNNNRDFIKENNGEAMSKDINLNQNNKSSLESLANINYNDIELNSLTYQEAKLIDKRKFFQYYLSLLKKSHYLIFTFYTSNDYNSKEIKICNFLFSFASHFTIYAFFF